MWNFAKLDTTPPNSPLSPFSASCHPQTVKYHNENPLSCHPFPPKLLSTCENIGLQSHLGPRNSQAHSSAPHPHQICTPGVPQPHPRRSPSHTLDAPPATPTATPIATIPPHPKSACNSQTGVTQRHEVIQTSNILRGNCMRNCWAAPAWARPKAAAPRLQHIRTGNKHPDR